MGACDICDGDERIPYTCNECGGQFCSQHRLPEAHYCEVLQTKSNPEWFRDELSARHNRQSTKLNTGADESRSSPEPMSPEDIRRNKTRTGSTDDTTTSETDAGSSNEKEDSPTDSPESEKCVRCGRITEKKCEKCGTPYCTRHVSPRVHNCAFVKPEPTAETSAQATSGGHGGSSRGSVLSTLFGFVFLPFVLLSALLGRVIRNWKLVVVLGLIVAPVGLATTGHLDDVADVGSGLAAEADKALSNDLDQERVEVLVHERINEVRQQHGQSPLNHDPALRSIASQYSEKMATEGFYSHQSPSGRNFEDRYEAAGYSCRVNTRGDWYVSGAENIQYTFAFTDVKTDSGVKEYNSEEELADALVEAWMNSEDHRETLLKPYWNNEGIGIAVIDNPDGSGMKVYATQNFC